jgi:hypothetical protein
VFEQIHHQNQVIGETEDSQTQFKQAIQLWTEIDAPKQIERVENARNQQMP